MLKSEIVLENGVEKCNRTVQKVIEGKTVMAPCRRPVTVNFTTKEKSCPNCDKEPPIGWVNPKITNSAGVALTPAELKQCGLTEDTSLKQVIPAPKIEKPKVAKKAVEAKVKKAKDVVTIQITLDSLEQAEDVARTLVTSAIKGMDALPVTNFAESRRLIKLQEKLQSLLEA